MANNTGPMGDHCRQVLLYTELSYIVCPITFISGEQVSNAVLTTVILQNHMYYRALESAVARVKAMGREPHVLDIGTGTGLLALMAAKAGATRVTACEVCVC